MRTVVLLAASAIAALTAAGCGLWHPRESVEDPTTEPLGDSGSAPDAAPAVADAAFSPCHFPQAETLRSGEACTMGACHPGFADADHASHNGCEAPCFAAPVRAQEAQCDDGIDDDCDGDIDAADSDCGPVRCPDDTVVDECGRCAGINIAHHPDHCGACDAPCWRHASAEAVCLAGVCHLRCLPRQIDGGVLAMVDDNGEWSDGCEAPCQRTNAGELGCDVVDDDCDGRVDEDYVGEPCDNDPGGEPRYRRCVDGRTECVGRAEVCMAREDGDIVGRCGVGACAATSECQGGAAGACVPGEPAPDTRCDGVDEDCDERVDEAFAPAPCDVPGSVCRHRSTCIDGGEVCVIALADEQVGDGTDDDCDGTIDEGDPTPPPCMAVDGIANDGEPCPADEPDCSCDEVDDDCDGRFNEDFAAVATRLLDPAEACRAPLACDRSDGAWRVIDGPGRPRHEACNGLDDDCDGEVDERANAGESPEATFGGVRDFVRDEWVQVCSPDERGVGICARPGVCEDGEWRCQPGEPLADDLTCDGRDEDCDGVIDEGFGAAVGGGSPMCGLGLCRRPQSCCTRRQCDVGGFMAGEVHDVFAGCTAPRSVAIGRRGEGWQVAPLASAGAPFEEPVLIDSIHAAQITTSGATLDLPDPGAGEAGGDIDCDGIDGTLAAAVFVPGGAAPAGAIGAGDLAAALARVGPDRPHIYLAAGRIEVGTPDRPLCVPAGVSIYGGFTPDWQTRGGRSQLVFEASAGAGLIIGGCGGPLIGSGDPPWVAFDRLRIEVPSRAPLADGDEGDPSVYGMQVRSGPTVRLRNVEVVVGRATTVVGQPLVRDDDRVGSAYGVLARGVTLHVEDSLVAVGGGGPGVNGEGGAAGEAGGPGSHGRDALSGRGDECPGDAQTLGGAAGEPSAACSPPPAGSGGDGNPGDGSAGNSAAAARCARGAPADATGRGGQGSGGVGADGCPGEVGAGAVAAHGAGCFDVTGRFWPPRAADGLTGVPGQGGGGGAGGRGGGRCPDVGASGGGGGAGGCGGRGGRGGLGGGGAFGIVAPDCPQCSIRGTRIALGTGGAGGGGGAGGAGGVGGRGGQGGSASASGAAGGAGGAGGPGGVGGAGAAAPRGPRVCAVMNGEVDAVCEGETHRLDPAALHCGGGP